MRSDTAKPDEGEGTGFMRIAHLGWALALAAVSSAAFASPCEKPRTQLDMTECAAQHRAQADKALNQAYTVYRKRLDRDRALKLRQAQRAWIKFRDATCVFESSGIEGGSAHPMVYQDCQTTKTEERLKALEALASCQEGDLSCPAPSASSAAQPARFATDGWIGTWQGPEGTFMRISGQRGVYDITIQNLDGPRRFRGQASDGETIHFTRDGVRESIRPTDGKATGMKWLADKTDCLTVRMGEGYCREARR